MNLHLRIRWCTAVLLLVALLPASVLANHIVGGEFHYECLGYKNDDPTTGVLRYRITINMYRDCIGTGAGFDGDPGGGTEEAPSSAGHISIYAGDRYFIRTLGITLARSESVPINLGNPCLVITEPICQEIGVYTFIQELPISEETYTFVYQRCCRNESIRNLIDPLRIGATYFIQITPAAQQRLSSSPEFNIDPPIAICIDEPFQIDLGATDQDGDSLAYVFCNPRLGGGTDGGRQTGFETATYFDDIVPLEESPYPYDPISWVSPRYSVDNQLGIGSTLTIDPVTGLLEGFPIYPGTHVLGVCVEEWSRGPNPVLLSETKREFQLNVARCGNTVNADLLETEIDEQGRFFIRQCGPGLNTIVNESTLINSILSYDWEMIGPGGQLITSNSRDFTTDIQELGTYEGVMMLNRNSFADNCKDTARFLLGVYPPVEAKFTATSVVCDPIPIEFTNLSEAQGGQRITNHEWDFGDASPSTRSLEPRHLYRSPGTFTAQLRVTDENGCQDEETAIVEYFPAPRTIILDPPDAFGCAPYGNQFVNRSFPIDDTYAFDWQFGDGGRSDERDPRHVYENTGTFDVYLSITSPRGCFVDTTFQRLIDVRGSPVADFDFSPEQPSNIFPDVRIIDRSVASASQRYEISDRTGTAIFSSPGPDFNYRLRDTSTLTVTQVVNHPSGCRDTLAKDIRMLLKNAFSAPNAFTPNGDGLNDSWRPEGIWEGATDYQLRIWNRWGEMIYYTEDFEGAWDGTHNGSNSPAGGYLWDVTFRNAAGEPESFKGGAVLIR